MVFAIIRYSKFIMESNLVHNETKYEIDFRTVKLYGEDVDAYELCAGEQECLILIHI